MHPHRRARTALAITAGIFTIALTAGAFWLSYEHLHDIAGAHLLTGSRAWAWPGTIDAFIIVGELLILRASLHNDVDGWAIALAAFGSSGSIALNICGVGVHASALDYTVAAVPPTAALVAFGALMRQVHEVLNRIPDAQPAAPADGPNAVTAPPAPEATAPAAPAQSPGALVLDLAPMLPASPEVTADAHPSAPAASAPTVPASGASDAELIEAARALAEHGPLSLRRMQRALGIGQSRAQRIRDAIDSASASASASEEAAS